MILLIALIALQSALIECSLFDASSGSQYNGQTLQCTAGEECIVLCDTWSACNGATIKCPPNNNCTVTCTGTNACQKSTIECPDDAYCDVTCAAAKACQFADFTWPTVAGLGSLTCRNGFACQDVEFPVPDPNTDLVIACSDGSGTCLNSTLYCPTQADCRVNCWGDQSCHHIWIDVALGDPNYAFSMGCPYVKSCDYIEFPQQSDDYFQAYYLSQYENETISCNDDKDCTIKCNSMDGCKDAYIQCPANANCTITCVGTSACRNAVIDCPPNSNCDVYCSGDYACENVDFTWPTAAGLGTLQCTQKQWACANIQFPIPDPYTDLVINCQKQYLCFNSSLICPTKADCQIQCWSELGCGSLTVDWPINDPNTTQSFSCPYTRACQDITFVGQSDDYFKAWYRLQYKNDIITCNDNEDCTVLCNSEEGCMNATITCPTNASCTIGCNGVNACYGATIACPPGYPCDVTCSGNYACELADFTWPTQAGLGSLTCSQSIDVCRDIEFPVPDPYTDHTIDCRKNGMCYGSTIYCPTDADCLISCWSPDSCANTTIHWPINDPNHTVTIACGYAWACEDITFFGHPDDWFKSWAISQYEDETITCADDKDCTVLCTALTGCRRVTIECPMNASCSVYCSGQNSCEGANIICPPNAPCDVKCVGIRSCLKASVVWAGFDKPGLGTLKCSSDDSCSGINFPLPATSTDYIADCNGRRACRNSTIFCPSAADCRVICNKEDACDFAKVYHMVNDVKWSLSYSGCPTQCQGLQEYNLIPLVDSLSPTAEPSKPSTSPTRLPSMTTDTPSTAPTFDPTSDPTVEPTTDPTKDPTAMPTMEPTKYPSTDPTSDPTIEPTKDPSMDPTLDPTERSPESSSIPGFSDDAPSTYTPCLLAVFFCFISMFVCI